MIFLNYQVNVLFQEVLASPPWGRRERDFRHNKKSEAKRLRIFNLRFHKLCHSDASFLRQIFAMHLDALDLMQCFRG